MRFQSACRTLMFGVYNCRPGARFSAGDLAHLPGAVDAAYWHAIGIAVPSDIEICGVARFLQKLRIRDKGEPRN